MSVIEHSRPCEDRLLGYAARHMPRHATFNITNLRDSAQQIRDARLAPPCECGRLQLAALSDLITAARRAPDQAGTVLARLLRQRIALRDELVGNQPTGPEDDAG